MTDHIRKMLKSQLPLMYLPYTKKQADAIYRLKHCYPTSEYDKSLLSEINSIIDNLNTALDLPEDTLLRLNKYNSLKHYVESLTTKLYLVPQDYLWIIYENVKMVLYKVKRLADNDTKVEVALHYLSKYNEVKTDTPESFEMQLVSDITSCLIFTYPHPELAIALEYALKTLSLYFTPTQLSKLFIDNVEYKIKRYIQEATHRLGKELIEWFRNLGNNKPNKQEDKKRGSASIYQEFLVALNKYQTTAKGLQQVLELAHELKSLPFNQVGHLPGFMENMNLVEHLQPFKNKR